MSEDTFELKLYKKHIPTYAAVQWTGKNVKEVKRFLGSSALITQECNLLNHGLPEYKLYVRKYRDERIHFHDNTFYNPTNDNILMEYGIEREKQYFYSTSTRGVQVDYGDYLVICDDEKDLTIYVLSPKEFERIFDFKETIQPEVSKEKIYSPKDNIRYN